MELNKILDFAIRINETDMDSCDCKGYVVNRNSADEKNYPDYMSDSAWDKFCEEMKTSYPNAYKSYKKRRW